MGGSSFASNVLVLLLLLLAQDPQTAGTGSPQAVAVSSNDTSLVVTVLGKTIKYQAYVWVALEQARAVNPAVPMYVVVYRQGYRASRDEIQARVQQLNVTVVFAEDLRTTPLSAAFHKHFFVQADMVPKDGNRALLKCSMERMFLLYELALRFNMRHIFHLENDNMLYVGLPGLATAAQGCRIGLGIPIVEPEQAVLSLVYAAGAQALEVYCRHVVGLYKLGRAALKKRLGTVWITDMSLTAHFLRSVHSVAAGWQVAVLPTWWVKPTEPPNCLWDAYPAIFDGAAMGQYFGGTHKQPHVRWYEAKRPFKELNTKKLQWKQSGPSKN
eukprot:EG_transcript_19041